MHLHLAMSCVVCCVCVCVCCVCVCACACVVWPKSFNVCRFALCISEPIIECQIGFPAICWRVSSSGGSGLYISICLNIYMNTHHIRSCSHSTCVLFYCLIVVGRTVYLRLLCGRCRDASFHARLLSSLSPRKEAKALLFSTLCFYRFEHIKITTNRTWIIIGSKASVRGSKVKVSHRSTIAALFISLTKPIIWNMSGN